MNWLKRQLTVQNMLMIAVLIGTFFHNSTAWVVDLATSSGETAKAVNTLVTQTQALTVRVDTLERLQLQETSRMAMEFPRRVELEPRLKAIEENGKENNMMLRRFMETYRYKP